MSVQKVPQFLSPKQVAQRLSVSPKTVYGWIRLGMPAVKIMGSVRIPENEFNRWFQIYSKKIQ